MIAAGTRTPFCKAGTALESVSAVELGRVAGEQCLHRAEIDPAELDAVIVGNVATPAHAANIARVIALQMGLPHQVPAHTVSRNCASGMEAAIQAARLIVTGEAELVAVVGVEIYKQVERNLLSVGSFMILNLNIHYNDEIY